MGAESAKEKDTENEREDLKLVSHGLTGRWVRNIFGVIVGVMLLISIVSSVIVHNYYINSVQQALESRAVNLVSLFFNRYIEQF